MANEYSHERAKKEDEKEALEYFLDAREIVTGESLELEEESESPDFICVQADGKTLGVELTRIRYNHPNGRFYEKVIEQRNAMGQEKAIDIINEQHYKKLQKIDNYRARHIDYIVLVFQLEDIPLRDIIPFIDFFLVDLKESLFDEVWLADFSEMDAFNSVELFCLKPNEIFGYYPREFQKPYG